MSRITVNQRESTIPLTVEEKILKTIQDGLPGISDILAIEIITERKKRVKILATAKEVPRTASDPLDEPPTNIQPQGQSIEGHPCIECETLQTYLREKGTKLIG